MYCIAPAGPRIGTDDSYEEFAHLAVDGAVLLEYLKAHGLEWPRPNYDCDYDPSSYDIYAESDRKSSCSRSEQVSPPPPPPPPTNSTGTAALEEEQHKTCGIPGSGVEAHLLVDVVFPVAPAQLPNPHLYPDSNFGRYIVSIS